MRAILVFATLGLVAAAALPAKDEERRVQLGNDMFRAGDHVELEDNVQGDALLAGGEVELRSSVGGDAVATGGDVDIGGSVGQDLYAAGGRITVTGTIGGSARIAGGEIELTDSADIADGASIAGGKVRLRGHVGRYLQIAGGEVRIDGRVDGDVNVSTGELVIGPDAVIEGRVTHRGPRPGRVSSEARVTGGVHHVQERYDGRVFRRVFGAFAFLWLLGWTLIGVLLLALLPQAARTITDGIRARPGASALLGFALLVGVPIVILIAAITLVGIPLAILLVLLYFVLLPLGYLASVVALVDSLLPRVRKGKPVTTALRIGAFVLAAFVLYLLTRIDFLGGLITLALVIVGVGGLAFAVRPGIRRGTPDPAV